MLTSCMTNHERVHGETREKGAAEQGGKAAEGDDQVPGDDHSQAQVQRDQVYGEKCSAEQPTHV